jgi:hypothetical protein
MLHHSTLRENQQPFGSSRTPAANKIIDFYTFDVGKVLHHSTLFALGSSTQGFEAVRTRSVGTTSKPGGDVNKPVQTLGAADVAMHQLHRPLLNQAQKRSQAGVESSILRHLEPFWSRGPP